jgi:hypothetical protein
LALSPLFFGGVGVRAGATQSDLAHPSCSSVVICCVVVLLVVQFRCILSEMQDSLAAALV